MNIPKKCGSAHRSHNWKIISRPQKSDHTGEWFQRVKCIDCRKEATESPIITMSKEHEV